ncbi:MAG TPA: DUF5362 domain-containing protein [Alcanivoracaceae bacterium]|nr:DUF5362 domain-containing protein [Alcanivoracaceae bacterium]
MDNQHDLIKRLSSPLYNSKGWIKFLGIMSIIMGCLVALSIVGLLVAWLPIWTGVLLLQTATALEQAFNTGDEVALETALSKLKTYFIIFGVIMLLQVVLTLLSFVSVGFLASTSQLY